METRGENCAAEGDVKAGQVPCWLDKDFVEEALNHTEEERKVRVESCDVKEATKLGDNYSTVVYRATAKLSDGQVRKLIFKCLPSNEARRQFANGLGIFMKEINVYEKLLPHYTMIHWEKIDPAGSMPWPKCYRTLHDGVKDFIALEDLEPQGFKMAERKTGLTERELRLVLQSLGRFHAYSIAYRLDDPESFRIDAKEKFHDTFFHESALQAAQPFFQGCLSAIEELLRSWKERKYDSAADQLHLMVDSFLSDLCLIVKSTEEETAVLCHGDFWVNNFLFRYDDEPCEVKFLDFQVVRYCSPALDLWYLLTTSINADVRHKHWGKFLEDVYLRSLRETLGKLGHHDESRENGIFSSDWLWNELANTELFGFATAVTTTPAALADADDTPDMDAITDLADQNPFKKLIRGKLFQERFKGLIDDFIESGLFN